jgi:hypothetical protein
MPEQELDLFQAAAILPTELRAGAPEVVRPEPLDTDLLGTLLDDRPDGPAAHALFDFAAFGDGPEQPARLCGVHISGRWSRCSRLSPNQEISLDAAEIALVLTS